MPNLKREEGFTLIELLVVIAIIGILAAVIFVALDPATRFADARDAVRQNDVQEILSAVKIYQVDNEGDLPKTQLADGSTSVTADETYVIGSASTGCDATAVTDNCDPTIDNASCIDLYDELGGQYLGDVPISPDGDGSWTAAITGYTYSVSGNGIVTISSCESENAGTIQAIR